MRKLFLNSRDELLIIELDKVAFFKASGNYTQLYYISGGSMLLTLGLTKIEEYIRRSWPRNTNTPFARLGRSLIINQNFLISISVLKQKVTLSDNEGHSFALTVPRTLVKEYKVKINELYVSKNGNDLSNREE